MKRILMMISGAALVLSLGSVFNACEGPAGKNGANGIDGVAGANGTNGANGKDGDAICGVCHNQGTVMYAKILQYENSVHFKGGDIEDDRGNPCIACHTSEGFVQRAATGLDTATSVPANPSPVNCRTCHNIHTNYDTTDWTLRDTTPVALMIDKSITLPDFGKGNLCAKCHQPRKPNPYFGAVGSDTLTITSSRWGLHHGPQAALLAGKAGYEFAGKSFGNSHHNTADNGCIECHMSTTLNLSAGGHTFKVSYDPGNGSKAFNLNACIGCHNGSEVHKITATDVFTKQSSIDTLVSNLKTKLITAQILDPVSGLPKLKSGKLKITNDQAGALLNYQLITEDRSHGLHNWQYSTDLLNASIAIFP